MQERALTGWLALRCVGEVIEVVLLRGTAHLMHAVLLLIITVILHVAMSLRVAIVGGGFAGLSTAFKLAKSCKELHIYDTRPAGQAAASSIAGGLMHPIAPRGNLMWNGMEGFGATKGILETLQRRGHQDVAAKPTELLRPVFSSIDLDSFTKACTATPHLLEQLTQDELDGLRISEAVGCFRIKQVMVLHPVQYLKALWQCTAEDCAGAAWIAQKVDDLQDLSGRYDQVVLANAWDMPRLWEQQPLTGGAVQGKLRVQYIRGRIFQYDSAPTAPDRALLNGEYMVPTQDRWGRPVLSCGSSHEHYTAENACLRADEMSYQDQPPRGDKAEQVLLQRLHRLWPALEQMQVVNTSSAVRLVTNRSQQGRLPIVGKHDGFGNVWTLTGLGSKGLIYHALLADYLTKAMLADDPDLIPVYLHPATHSASKQ